MQELPRALLVKASQHADNRIEFDKQFDRLLALSFLKVVLETLELEEFMRLLQSPAIDEMIMARLATNWPFQAAVLKDLVAVYRDIARGVERYTSEQMDIFL